MKAQIASPPAAGSASLALHELVAGLFTGMVQALRALQLYGPTKLATERALDAVRTGFEQVWSERPDLDVEVHAESIRCEGRPVYENSNHNDSLAFLLYRDGIRTLSFHQGFETEELLSFLLVLHKARYQASEAEDLVTLLWDEDFLHLRHGYIDADATPQDTRELEAALTAVASPDAHRSLTLHIHDASVRAVAHAEQEAGSAPGSPDPPALPDTRVNLQRRTLHLDPEALVYLQHELEEEMRRQLQEDVANALLDSLEEPDPSAQSEILEVLAQLIPQLVAARQLRLVASILGDLRALAEQPQVLDAERRQELEALFRNLGATSAVQEFLAALESGDIQTDLDSIGSLACHLGSSLLPRLLRAREKGSGRELRAALDAAVEHLTREDPKSLQEALGSADPLVLRGALRILPALGAVEMLPATLRLLEHADTRVRLGAVEVLVALGTPAGLEALLRLIEDPVREVRTAALWGLATWQYEPARSRLEVRIDSKAFRDADADEKMAVLDAYARIGAGAAVERLAALLHARSLLRPKEPSDLRACAAHALGDIAADEAKAHLAKAQDDRDPEVRRAVQRALRKAVKP